MRLKQAYEKARKANRKDPRIACRIVKKNYSGYDVVCEPVELPMIRSSTQTVASFRRGFSKNVRIKYGR